MIRVLSAPNAISLWQKRFWGKILNNYQRLIAKIDERCRKIYLKHRDYISCQEGCCGCCRHISVFAVEAAALSLALSNLPRDILLRVRQNAKANPDSEICPLLENGACVVYESRPVICRTHGLPILVYRNNRHEVNFCPLNFQDISSFSSESVIDLEKLNQMLFAINRLFLSQSSEITTQERFRISDLL